MCIIKVLSNRLRDILPDSVYENQGGFVHGRYIVHNIMIIQDLGKHYGMNSANPSCVIMIDM